LRTQCHPTLLVHPKLLNIVAIADAVNLGMASGANRHQVVFGIWPTLTYLNYMVQVNYFVVFWAKTTSMHRVH
jgi:hypothetical protein